MPQLALVTAQATRLTRWTLRAMTFAHILAEAVQALFPGTQITFGPSTDDGFYYDFAPAKNAPFTDEDLPAIEERRCARSSARDKPLRREVNGAANELISAVEAAGRELQGANGPPNFPENEPN